MSEQSTRCVVGEVRLGFARTLTTPEVKQNQKTGDEYTSYGCTLYIPKTDKALLDKLRGAFNAAKEKDKSKFGNTTVIKSPFLDGDEVLKDGDIGGEQSEGVKRFGKDPQAAGHYLLRVNTYTQPDLVKKVAGKFVKLEKNEVYSGMWAYVSLNAAGYPAIDGGKPGVKFYLGNVCKTRDDTPLGGGSVSASDEFADMDVPECAAGQAPGEQDDFLM